MVLGGRLEAGWGWGASLFGLLAPSLLAPHSKFLGYHMKAVGISPIHFIFSMDAPSSKGKATIISKKKVGGWIRTLGKRNVPIKQGHLAVQPVKNDTNYIKQNATHQAEHFNSLYSRLFMTFCSRLNACL